MGESGEGERPAKGGKTEKVFDMRGNPLSEAQVDAAIAAQKEFYERGFKSMTELLDMLIDSGYVAHDDDFFNLKLGLVGEKIQVLLGRIVSERDRWISQPPLYQALAHRVIDERFHVKAHELPLPVPPELRAAMARYQRAYMDS